MLQMFTIYIVAAIFLSIIFVRFTEALTNHEPLAAFRPFGRMTVLAAVVMYVPNNYITIGSSFPISQTAPGAMTNIVIATALVLATCAAGSWLARAIGRMCRPRELV